MLRKHFIKNRTNVDLIRWRLHEPARIEAFSDSVMAFAVTLLVVSLEVPKTYEDLLFSLRGVVGFAICFLLLMFIWRDQYLFFRRYGLQDTRTIAYNAMLIFVLLVYVYPLKFLFSYLTQGNDVLVNGKIIERFTSAFQVAQLMIIYSAGYIILNILFVLMYFQALKRKEEIELSSIEIFNTYTFIYVYFGLIGIGVVSILLALTGLYINPNCIAFSGIIYSIIGLVISVIYKKRKKIMNRTFSTEEIDSLKQHLNMEE